MKYYELHETFWKQLKDKGHISWDRENKEELLDRERNFVLQKYLDDFKVITALDLGCGSGSQSFYLSNQGIRCSAVDISQTAIDIGTNLAADMGFEIDFHCHDICSLNLNH